MNQVKQTPATGPFSPPDTAACRTVRIRKPLKIGIAIKPMNPNYDTLKRPATTSLLTAWLLAGSAFASAPPLMAALAPALPAIAKDLAIGLAGEFLYDGAQWYFSERPDRSGRLEAEAELVTINDQIKFRQYYSNQLMEEGTRSAYQDSKYERFKWTAACLNWNDEDQNFDWGETLSAHGMLYVDLSAFMNANVNPGQERSGFYLYWGETEKVAAEHFLRSKIRGSGGDTLALSRAGRDQNKRYTVLVDATLNDVFYDKNGTWREVTRDKRHTKAQVLSAAASQNMEVELLKKNTTLHTASVHGRSTLFWKKVARSSVYMRPAPTGIFVGFPDCGDDCCASNRNPTCYDHGSKIPVLEDQPTPIFYKEWDVDQALSL